jgi:tetratricopeptide (TPR) repeat protein
MSTTALHLRRAGGLDDAERAAADGFDWCAIAAARAAAGDREGASRCLDRAIELGAADVVVVRNAARTWQALGDRDAACRALAAAASRLMTDEPPSRAWCMIAAGWDEAGDRDAARYYLEHARARAGTVGELCEVALGYHLLGELEVARALVERAEARAAEVTDHLDAIDAWLFVLGEPGRGQALLERAVASAPAVHELVRLARANETLFPTDDYEVAERLLGAGDALARTPEDWIELADAWASIRCDSFEAAARLDRGAALTSDPATLAHIANERRRHRYRAEDPYRPPPPTPRTPGELLPRRDGWAFRPDPARLFDDLRARITPEQLHAIASNDYGWRTQESLAILSEIAATGRIGVPLDGNVRENLELARWSGGPDVDHVERAFACTLICLAGPGNVGGEHESMSVLLDSCIALGAGAVDGMLGLFAAIADDVFIQLGLVLGAAWRDPGDPRIAPAIARLDAIDRSFGAPPRWPGGFVFGRSNFDQRYELWRSLARTILAAPVPRLRELAVRLRLG